jgi:endonuclease YncB( thermonuclease family)
MIQNILLLASVLTTACPDGDLRRAKVVRVLDGDTVDAVLDFSLGIEMHERLRFLGINTPELDSKDPAERAAAAKAKAYVEGQLPPAADFLACIGKRDDFGRVLATVLVGRKNLNQTLLDKKLAKPYKK